MHEIFHQLGLGDEYIKGDGKAPPISRLKDNLMDLQGWNLNTAQGADLLSRHLMFRGWSITKGVQATYGGTLNTIKNMKFKNIYY